MNYDAFISYRREGGAAEARLLRQSLMARGLNVFLDVTDLHKGYFDEELLQRISAAPNFIPILTPGALDRCADPHDWMRQEIRHAIREKRNIVPVIVEDFVFPPTLPDDIVNLPRHQGVQYSHQYFDAMTQSIVDHLEVTSGSRPATTPAASPSPPRAPTVATGVGPLHWVLHLLIGATLGLLGAAIGMEQWLRGSVSAVNTSAVLQVCGLIPGAAAAVVARRFRSLLAKIGVATIVGAMALELEFLFNLVVLSRGSVDQFNHHLPFWLGLYPKDPDVMMREAFGLGLRLGAVAGLLAGLGDVVLQVVRRRWRAARP